MPGRLPGILHIWELVARMSEAKCGAAVMNLWSLPQINLDNRQLFGLSCRLVSPTTNTHSQRSLCRYPLLLEVAAQRRRALRPTCQGAGRQMGLRPLQIDTL
jgi:hypothetical protein